MTRVAIVQSYPYQAIKGGDAAYLVSIIRHLASRGHQIFGLLTDITRGRTSPVYRSAYDLPPEVAWTVRQAAPIGRGFVSLSPSQWLKPLLKPLGRPAPPDDREAWTRREAAWLNEEFKKIRPQCAILLYGAAGFSKYPLEVDRAVAIPGFLLDRQRVLGADNSLVVHEDTSRLRDQLAWLAEAECVGLSTRDDIDFAHRHGLRRTIKVALGFPDRAVGVSSPERAPIVLFVGARTPPNLKSCQWLLGKVWPTVLRRRPDARLRLVGDMARAVSCRDVGGVEPVGFVGDLTAEYAQASVVVAPLVSGSRGVKVKVVEALSFGRALVTTSIGVDAGDPEQLSGAVDVADTPDDFAAAILALLDDPDRRASREDLALRAFHRLFSYDAAFKELVDHLGL